MTLADNIHRLIRPHLAMRPDGKPAKRDAYLDQLANAVTPGMRVGGTGGAGDYAPANTAAIDLWKVIDTIARDTEARRTGTSRGTLGNIIEKWEEENRTEWEEHLEAITVDMIDRITQLLDPPPRRRPLGAPCYDCGTEWTYTLDGERTPAVTIGTHHPTGELRDLPEMDMECTACGKTWHGQEMRWPLKVLQDA